MQNEFDDHIKKQVEHFKLPPSPQVWDLVEAQLPEKRRKRLIFWWLSLGIFLIGFGIYEFVGNEINNKEKIIDKTIVQINTSNKTDSSVVFLKVNKTDRILDKGLNKISTIKFLHKLNNNNKKVEKITLIKKNIGEEIVFNNDGDNLKVKKIFNDKSVLSGNNIFSNENKKKEIVIKDNSDGNIINDIIINESIDSTVDLVKPEIKKDVKDTGLIKTKKAANKNNSQKVKWLVIADIGNANTVGKAFSSYSNSLNYSSPYNSVTTPGNPNTFQASLSSPTSGVSFGINLQRTQKITNKIAWFGSIGYHYLSNHQASGSFVDSSKTIGADSSQIFSSSDKIDKVGSYYKYGNTVNHNNYAHLLNISLGLKYNISKVFSLNGGIGLGYQIKSKWLQPDAKQSILYYSEKLTNRWNVDAKVVFDCQLAKPFSVGFFYNYSFSNASLAEVQQNLHWQSFGVTISVQLPFRK